MSWSKVFQLWDQITKTLRQNVPDEKAKLNFEPPKYNLRKKEQDR